MNSDKLMKWMRMCETGAGLFSTCGKRQYFSIVLDPVGRLIGSGYNGSAPGQPHCIDGGCPRWPGTSAPGSSYDNCISIHAEENALLYSDFTARRGGALLVNGTPCWGCAKKVAGSGVADFAYKADDSYADLDRCIDLITSCGIRAWPL